MTPEPTLSLLKRSLATVKCGASLKWVVVVPAAGPVSLLSKYGLKGQSTFLLLLYVPRPTAAVLHVCN